MTNSSTTAPTNTGEPSFPFTLAPELMNALGLMGVTTLTPIQSQAIPIALTGQDVIGTAQTGSGKTLAFSLPLISFLMKSPSKMALVLAPTRELAQQVGAVITKLSVQIPGIKVAELIGGADMRAQAQKLKQRPRVIVGTPGRIIDHLERGNLLLAQVGFIVLDEMDRMLDMGFTPQLEMIEKFLPKQKQTLMFSATLPPKIQKMAEDYMTTPQRITVGTVSKPTENITQEILYTDRKRKLEHLCDELTKREGSAIVFAGTKRGVDDLKKQLSLRKFKVGHIHGDLSQRGRDDTLRSFRDGHFRILLATDVASRGLDIPHIAHVINYDLPQNPEDYIHRIGRTARAGAKGSALTMLTSANQDIWERIVKLMGPGVSIVNISSDEGGSVPAFLTDTGSSGKKRGGASSHRKGTGSRQRSEGGERRERREERGERTERTGERSERRPSRSDKPERGERSERPGRSEKNDRPKRSGERAERSGGKAERSDRPYRERSERPERGGERSERADRPYRERSERAERSDRPERSERSGEGRKKFFDKGSRDENRDTSRRRDEGEKPRRDRDGQPPRDGRKSEGGQSRHRDKPTPRGDKPAPRGDKSAHATPRKKEGGSSYSGGKKKSVWGKLSTALPLPWKKKKKKDGK